MVRAETIRKKEGLKKGEKKPYIVLVKDRCGQVHRGKMHGVVEDLYG
jgi:hypothetical protein